MPVGPYETFQDCVDAQVSKGKSEEDSRKVCGAIEKQKAGAAQTFEANNRLFVKAFLIDDSLNINKWRVTKSSIEKNINSFIGKPLVLTESYDHPSPNGGNPETLNHWLAYQESFRVGTIIDISTKQNPTFPNSKTYHAIIEVTNDDLKAALRNNAVPIYVSPAIAELIGQENASVAAAAELNNADLVNEWSAVHLAIVDQPAFGVKKATISATCGGSKEGCLLQLRQAHVDKYGAEKCGFCVKKAMQKYKILRKLDQNLPIDTPKETRNELNTSHAVAEAPKVTGNPRKMSQLENSEPSPGTVQPTTQQQQPVEKVEMHIPPATKAPVQIPGANTSDLLAKIEKLEHMLQLKDLKIDELSNVNDTFGQRVAALESERRRERLERIITPDVIKDEKTRIDKIKYFLSKKDLPIEDIEEIYRDNKILARKASINSSQRRGVPYLGANLGTSGVMSSGHNSNPSVDEDTGLTPLQKQLAVLRGGP